MTWQILDLAPERSAPRLAAMARIFAASPSRIGTISSFAAPASAPSSAFSSSGATTAVGIAGSVGKRQAAARLAMALDGQRGQLRIVDHRARGRELSLRPRRRRSIVAARDLVASTTESGGRNSTTRTDMVKDRRHGRGRGNAGFAPHTWCRAPAEDCRAPPRTASRSTSTALRRIVVTRRTRKDFSGSSFRWHGRTR